MHCAFFITEIRRMILKHCRKNDVAAFAMATFNSGFVSLFDSIIDDLYPHGILDEIDEISWFLPGDLQYRDLGLEDLRSLDRFSRVIQCIHTPSDASWVSGRDTDFSKSWEQVWLGIAELRHTGDLFPNLKHIHIAYTDVCALLPLIGISGAELEEVHLNLYSRTLCSENVIYRFFDELANVSELKYLHIDASLPQSIPPSIFLEAPLKTLFLKPQCVQIADPPVQLKTSQFPLQIFQMHEAESLLIHLNREWNDLSRNTSIKKGLSKLKLLLMDLGADISTLLAWLSPAQFAKGFDKSPLEVIFIRFAPFASGNIEGGFLRSMRLTCDFSKLSRLSIWFPNDKMDPDRSLEILLALLPLPNLKELELGLGPHFLSDMARTDPYRHIAAGLPRLEVLKTLRFQPGPFLLGASIHHLARFCRNFHSLYQVHIQYMNLFVLDESIHLDCECPAVTKLSFGLWRRRSSDRRPPRSNVFNEWGEERIISRAHYLVKKYFPNSDLAKVEDIFNYPMKAKDTCISHLTSIGGLGNLGILPREIPSSGLSHCACRDRDRDCDAAASSKKLSSYPRKRE